MYTHSRASVWMGGKREMSWCCAAGLSTEIASASESCACCSRPNTLVHLHPCCKSDVRMALVVHVSVAHSHHCSVVSVCVWVCLQAKAWLGQQVQDAAAVPGVLASVLASVTGGAVSLSGQEAAFRGQPH